MYQTCHCSDIITTVITVIVTGTDIVIVTQLNSTQLYYDTFAAEQLNSWIAKYSSII